MATLTVTIPDELVAVNDRFSADHPGWLDGFVTLKLQEFQARFGDDDRRAFEEAFKNLAPGRQAAIRAELEQAKPPKSK